MSCCNQSLAVSGHAIPHRRLRTAMCESGRALAWGTVWPITPQCELLHITLPNTFTIQHKQRQGWNAIVALIECPHPDFRLTVAEMSHKPSAGRAVPGGQPQTTMEQANASPIRYPVRCRRQSWHSGSPPQHPNPPVPHRRATSSRPVTWASPWPSASTDKPAVASPPQPPGARPTAMMKPSASPAAPSPMANSRGLQIRATCAPAAAASASARSGASRPRNSHRTVCPETHGLRPPRGARPRSCSHLRRHEFRPLAIHRCPK
jgi:hypothetical protein